MNRRRLFVQGLSAMAAIVAAPAVAQAVDVPDLVALSPQGPFVVNPAWAEGKTQAAHLAGLQLIADEWAALTLAHQRTGIWTERHEAVHGHLELLAQEYVHTNRTRLATTAALEPLTPVEPVCPACGLHLAFSRRSLFVGDQIPIACSCGWTGVSPVAK